MTRDITSREHAGSTVEVDSTTVVVVGVVVVISTLATVADCVPMARAT